LYKKSTKKFEKKNFFLTPRNSGVGGSLKRNPVPEWYRAQLGDGKAPEAVQPPQNPSDLPLPHAIEPQINITRNLTCLNYAKN